MRAAITLFEQYAVGGVLKRKYIEENLELIGEDFLVDFTESLISRDIEKTLKNLTFLREKSLDVRLFLEQLLFFLRDRMKDTLKKPAFRSYANLFEIFEGIYGRLKFSPDPFLLLETSTFRSLVSDNAHVTPVVVAIERSSQASSTLAKKTLPTAPTPSQEEPSVAEPTSPPIARVAPVTSDSPTAPFEFNRFIEHIRTVPKRSFV